MALLLALGGVSIISLIVFGGGQVFMPLFKSLWQMMNKLGANISDQQIDNIFAVSNSTPGVVSTKFSMFTGYFAANGEWWGWLLMFATYIMFTIPAIIMVWWVSKLVNKSDESKHLNKVIVYLKPVIAGIVIALAIQLFISTAFPKIIFNGSEYIGEKSSIFNSWRLYVLIPYTIMGAIESSYFYLKKKVNLFWLIIIHISIGIALFQPWLM